LNFTNYQEPEFVPLFDEEGGECHGITCAILEKVNEAPVTWYWTIFSKLRFIFQYWFYFLFIVLIISIFIYVRRK
jgi:hypothetical protein